MALPLPEPYFKGKKITSQDLNKILDVLDGINTIEDHVEFGKVLNIPTSSTGLASGIVYFTKAFLAIPYVFLSLENVSVNVLVASIFCTNVSAESFTWNILITRPRPNTYCNVNWLALV